MREIKFRGKRVDNWEWIYGLLARKHEDFKKVFIDFFPEHDDNQEYRLVNPVTVGQYTGLKDRNGTEIYEGDILDCGDRVVRVTWHKNCGTWDSEFTRYKGQRMSSGIEAKDWCFRAIVIGNIYDNPELLEVK